MSALTFEPWNASANVDLDGVRLLVVAESHYKELGCHEEFTVDETTKIVRNNAPGFVAGSGNSLFSKIADALSSEKVARDEVWKRIYYCNYFQRPFETSSEKPLPDDYEKSSPQFDRVLQNIRPDAVLVVSSRLWHRMPNEAAPEGAYQGEEGLGRAYRFTGEAGLRIPAAHTWHPSARRGFRVKYWKPRIAHFLAWVKDSDLAATNR